MGKNVKIINQKASNFFRLFGDGVREFCEHTPIHGVPYAGQGGRTPKERVIWILVLVFAMTSCCYLITSRFLRWNETPVLVNLKEEPLNVWDVPLPTVTICSDRLQWPSSIYHSNCSSAGAELVNATMCYKERKETYDFGERGNCTAEEAFKEFIELCVYEEKAAFFSFRGPLFGDILLTELGVCSTLNSYHPSDIFKDEVMTDLFVVHTTDVSRPVEWTVSKGYINQNATFPFRAYSSDIRDSMFVLIYKSLDDDGCELSPFTGYTLTLHLPTEYPSLFKEPINIAQQKSSFVAVKPKLLFAGADVRSLPINRRKCLFDDESPLRFFRFYTDTNCDVECLTNYTYQTCKCVPPYLPRGVEMEICKTGKNIKCALDASEALLTYNFNNRDSVDSCNCLPNCNSLLYEYLTVDANMSTETRDYFKKIVNTTREPLLFVTIFQSESLIWATKRTRFTSLVDFLADCGGLMGLSMGISIVSIIEILYHCTFRCVGRAVEEPETLQQIEDDKTRTQQEDAEDVIELKPLAEE